MKSRFADICLGILAFAAVFGIGFMVHGAQNAQLDWFNTPFDRVPAGAPEPAPGAALAANAQPAARTVDNYYVPPSVGATNTRPECEMGRLVCRCVCNDPKMGATDSSFSCPTSRGGDVFPADATTDCNALNGIQCGPADMGGKPYNGKLEGCSKLSLFIPAFPNK